jgi:hypothetical protein
MQEKCEIGVHGIDSWHSVEKGREELARIAGMTGRTCMGIRMHWLLQAESTFQVLDEAGYDYDSTVGYNETIGYRSGTAQTFRPVGAQKLLELPLHIQDGALFYPQRLGLNDAEAWQRCQPFIDHVRSSGGVLTLLWHDRSHAAERFWGDFYERLVTFLRSTDAYFGSATQVVGWFRKRRQVVFVGQKDLSYQGCEIEPALTIRFHNPQGCSTDSSAKFVDVPWNGMKPVGLDERPHSVPNAIPGETVSSDACLDKSLQEWKGHPAR